MPVEKGVTFLHSIEILNRKQMCELRILFILRCLDLRNLFIEILNVIRFFIGINQLMHNTQGSN